MTERRPIAKLAQALLWGLGLALWLKLCLGYSAVGSDFEQDYLAFQALSMGRSIYGATISELALSMLNDRGIENFHPPFNALLFATVGWLPFREAFVVWGTLSLALYVGSLAALFKELRLERKISEWLLPISLFWHPFIFCIATGQSSILIASSIIFGFLMLRRGREALAGCAFGFACLIKLFPGLLIMHLFLARRFRAAFCMCATIACGMGISAAAVGRQDFWMYFTEVMSKDVRHWAYFPANTSIKGFVSPVLLKNPYVRELANVPLVESALAAAFSLAILAVAFTACRRALARGGEDRSIAIVVTAMLILSPISWSHVFLILALPILVVWKERRSNKPIFLALVLVSLPDIEMLREAGDFFRPLKMPWYAYLCLKGPFYGLLLLLVLLSRANGKSRGEGVAQ